MELEQEEDREAFEAALIRRESKTKDLSVVRSGSFAYVLQWFMGDHGWDYCRVMARVRVEPQSEYK